MKSLKIMFIVAIIMLSGCASMYSVHSSRKELGEQSIRAVQVEDGVGIGVDISNLDAIKLHPWRQAGCAVVDAFTFYAVYEGINALEEEDKKEEKEPQVIKDTDTSRDTIIVNGDNNTTTITYGSE